jgi:hypothetical protein
MWDRSLFAAALLLTVSGIAWAAERVDDSSEPTPASPENPIATESSRQEPADGEDQKETATSKTRNPRVLYISMKGCPACSQELARLRRPGGDFDGMRAMGWKIGTTPDCHVQIVDRDATPDLVAQFNIHSFPTVICINDKEIVRSFSSGCTTPLDSWTFGFLLKGENERPKASIPEAARVAWTGSYPLRGNHWSVDSVWNPTREHVVSHLRGTHGSQIAASYVIESWSYEELRSLHDDLHEREVGVTGTTSYAAGGSYYSGYYPSQPTRSVNFTSAGHKMGL